MKKSRVTALIGALSLAAVALNVLVAEHDLPFGVKKTSYQVEDILVESKWVSSAPIFLTQNFKRIEVTNTGDENLDGFGFSKQILEIWKGGTADLSQPPIDLRDKANLQSLLSLSKFNTKVYCTVDGTNFCRADVIWDDSANRDFAKFTGVRTDKDSFALVENTLLERFLAGEK